jgi:hypothetical protein
MPAQRITFHRTISALLLAAATSAAATGTARADGRLASYPLVYRLTPATTEDPVFEYVAKHLRDIGCGAR